MRAAAFLLVLAAIAVACGASAVEILPAAELTGVPAAPTATPSPTASRDTPAPAPTPVPSTATPATVSRLAGIDCEWAEVADVADGDTLTVRTGDGREEAVRLIGVDAPEGAQAHGDEASALLAELAADRVCLEADTTDRDRLGRLLRYVWREDGTLLNEAMLRAGLALVVTFPPDTRHLESRYLPAEAEARAAGRGLWAALPTPGPDGDGAGDGECDPSYPDVCIPPVSLVGDLNCADIPHRRFRVLPPDPHRFDGNRDGVGCEG